MVSVTQHKLSREALMQMGLDIRPIPQCDGYFADNQGGIWSSWNRGASPGKWSAGSVSRKGELLRKVSSRPHVRSGHLQVNLKGGLATKVCHAVHQLVASAFFGPPPPKMEVRHLNGIPHDNRIENLRYGTRKENIRDGVNHGTMKPEWLPLEFR